MYFFLWLLIYKPNVLAFHVRLTNVCQTHIRSRSTHEFACHKKVQVGKDQEKAQSEKDSHSKNRGGKNQTNNQVLIP